MGLPSLFNLLPEYMVPHECLPFDDRVLAAMQVVTLVTLHDKHGPRYIWGTVCDALAIGIPTMALRGMDYALELPMADYTAAQT